MIQGRVSGSVRPQIEAGAGRPELPFWYVRFPRHVLRYVKTWRGDRLFILDLVRQANTVMIWRAV